MENQPQDMLQELFDHQLALQKRLNATFDQNYISMMTLACIDELMESLRETPWKSWKKKQTMNHDQFQKELIDAWHFLINLSLASGMTATDVNRLYLEKNKENHQRKDTGY